MATRRMYEEHPGEFLLWYFNRFVLYRKNKPNLVHKWLSNKYLITQNIDCLDAKSGNKKYIAIHGRIDKVTKFHKQGDLVDVNEAPWDLVVKQIEDPNDDLKKKNILLDSFKISRKKLSPVINESLKPLVLLFDEYYTEMYEISKAKTWMLEAEKFIFIGTSFSVGITAIALEYAIKKNSKIEVVDPNPIGLKIPNVKYKAISAVKYVEERLRI